MAARGVVLRHIHRQNHYEACKISEGACVKLLITVRPWRAAGGSSVHDESIPYEAESVYDALMKLYADREYDFSDFRVIDIKEERA